MYLKPRKFRKILKTPDNVAIMLPPAVAQAAPWYRKELTAIRFCAADLSGAFPWEQISPGSIGFRGKVDDT